MNTRKPQILYHGTNKRDVKEFAPDNKRIRNKQEGMVLFATPHKAFATMYLGPRPDDTWSNKGRFNDVYYIVIEDEERFRKEDNGGTIFTFSSDTFTCDKNKGMGFSEWISKEQVIPIASEHFDSALNTMIDNEVQVYFVNQEKFKKIKTAKDHGVSILRKLQSENQKNNRNIKNF